MRTRTDTVGRERSGEAGGMILQVGPGHAAFGRAVRWTTAVASGIAPAIASHTVAKLSSTARPRDYDWALIFATPATLPSRLSCATAPASPPR